MDITRALAIKGWMTHRELTWLAQQAEKSQVVYEFGSYKGRSTRALGDHCPGQVFAVDPWEGPYIKDDGTTLDSIRAEDAWPVFMDGLKDLIESGKVVPIKGKSLEVRPSQYADLIFLDGDHRYEVVKKEIALYRWYLKPSGILAGHDYNHKDWPAVKRAVDEIGLPVQKVDSLWWVQCDLSFPQ